MNVVLKKCPVRKAEALRRYVRSRISLSFQRFSHMVENVSVFFTDENGPRNGLDKTCKLIVSTVYGEKIIIRETQESWEFALNHAVKRGRRSLGRTLDSFKNGGPSNDRELKLLAGP